MKELVLFMGSLLMVTGWIVAEGAWSTFFAVIFFPYAWYLALEHFGKLLGVL